MTAACGAGSRRERPEGCPALDGRRLVARLLAVLFGRRAGVQSMGRVRPQASAWPYRQQPQKRFSVRF